MLSKILLKNFRCFDEHEIKFKNLCVLVGKNNAGKSTLVEALRLLSIVIERYKYVSYKSPPDWANIAPTFRGISPSLQGFNFTFDNICYLYREPPAVIKAIFSDKSSVEIYINNGNSIFALLRNNKQRVIGSKSQAQNFNFQEVRTMPQIGPLLKEEMKLDEEYVKRNISSSLSSLHFRNQLLLFPDEFKSFKQFAEKTWNELQLNKPDYQGLPNDPINFFIRDSNFLAEVGWVGQGLQMWLQMLWFLSRCKKDYLVILDEPDVYLHPDLQRKLIRLLKNKYKQIILTTHSIEIISEIEPTNILIIDKSKESSNFAIEFSAVQKLLDHIGSVHNINLTRLFSAKKFIIVEGKDMAILRRLSDALFPESDEPIAGLPQMECEGWGGWNYAIGSSMLLENSIGQDITAYCLFDSDYKTENTINKRKEDAKKRSIHLHIWKKKEIENYLLVTSAILRLIEKKCKKNKAQLTEKIIETKMQEICENFKDKVFDSISTEYAYENKSQSNKEANKYARKKIEDNWQSLTQKCSIISGKEIISKLSDWSKASYGVSFNPASIASELTVAEIDEEMKGVLKNIELNEGFS